VIALTKIMTKTIMLLFPQLNMVVPLESFCLKNVQPERAQVGLRGKFSR
jgi:hypothetical protein